MKRKILKLSIPIIIVLISILFFSYTQVRFDHNNIRIEGFYKEEKDSIDVVFLGASELYSDYSPVYAYERLGVTSYNYSIEDNPINFYKWELDEVFRYQSPKLVVVELSSAVSESELKEDSGYFDATLRKITDSTPLFGYKNSLIKQYGTKNNRDSYFFPLLLYHTSPPSFTTMKERIGFKSRGYSLLKGAVTHTNSKKCRKENLYNIQNDNKMIPVSKKQEHLLVALIEHCKQNNYNNVIFTRFPHRIENKKNYQRYCEGNYIKHIVKEKGFDYIDFEQMTEEIGIDKIDDFADGEHLRASGQKKFSYFVLDYLIKKYDINKSVLNTQLQEKWNQCVKYIDAFYDYYDCVKNGKKDVFLCENNDLLILLEKKIIT